MPDSNVRSNDTIIPVLQPGDAEVAHKLLAASQGSPDRGAGDRGSESGIPVVRLVDRQPRSHGGWYEIETQDDKKPSGQKKVVAFSDGTQTYHLAPDGNSWTDSAGQSRFLQVTPIPNGSDIQVKVVVDGSRAMSPDSLEGKGPLVTRKCASDATREYTVDAQGNVIEFEDKSHVKWKRDFRGSKSDWVDPSGKVKTLKVETSASNNDIMIFPSRETVNNTEGYLRTEKRPGGGSYTYNSITGEVESFSGPEGSWVLDRATKQWSLAGNVKPPAADAGFSVDRAGNDIRFKGQGTVDVEWKKQLVASESQRSTEGASRDPKASAEESVSGAGNGASEKTAPDIVRLVPDPETVEPTVNKGGEGRLALTPEAEAAIKSGEPWIQEIRTVLHDPYLSPAMKTQLESLQRELCAVARDHDLKRPGRWVMLKRLAQLDSSRGEYADSRSFVSDLAKIASDVRP